jgi:hypothetical protein
MKRLIVILMIMAPGCKEKAPAPEEKSPVDDGMQDLDIKSVYPMEVKPAPIAEKLCRAIHALQRERHAACCQETPGVHFASECVRMLSAALESKVVRLDESAVDRCVELTKTSLEGCDWVGTWPPIPPKACLHLVEGLLERGKRCRSALECKSGLRCAGLDPVRAGRCLPPGASGEGCGGTTDPLAGYTAQYEAERDHPPCAGFCDRARCVDAPEVGAACKSGSGCGRDLHCAERKCTKGAFASVGESCFGSSCEYGARCIAEKCALPKPSGESCAEDVECAASCVKAKAGDARGICKSTCDLIVGLKRVRRVLTATNAGAVPR